ncbi:MAG: hypothetical protein GXP60_01195 [Epsilonproteobacteria bacterium]|nr:hypothetical protein [Campylobacterota bacterium]
MTQKEKIVAGGVWKSQLLQYIAGILSAFFLIIGDFFIGPANDNCCNLACFLPGMY